MAEANEGVNSIDARPGSVEEQVTEFRSDVQRLRIVGEDNLRQTTLVAEVQAHHGKVLDELRQDVQPLKGLRVLMQQIAQDHERRITALESPDGKKPVRSRS